MKDMDIKLRAGNPADTEACSVICYEAFKTISERHNFPPDFPSAAAVNGLLAPLFSMPNVYAVVAERQGRIVGSNFLWKDSTIAGVGPITIAPDVQNSAIGRSLMEDVLEHARERRMAGVRLVQAAYHSRSLALYTKLGFDVQEPLVNFQGPAVQVAIPGYTVRPASKGDLAACNRLCRQIHGHDRSMDLQGAIQQGTATVVEHDGRISGYATSIGFLGHAVGESNEEIKALIGAAESFPGPGFLLPARNAELFRWCLQQGLRVVQTMTLMSLGVYKQPTGAFLPSVLY